MAEKQNNAVATAGNIAHKLHGTAQIVRGAVTADFLAVASGATKVLSPKVIAGIIAAIMLIVMIPILVIFSLPQVLFNWGSLKDTELMARHEHANYLMSCYDDTDLSEEDKLWLISGVELIGITAGEAKNPQVTLRSAVGKVLWRILIFYVGAIFVIVTIFPWNEIGSNGSPFVLTFAKIGITAAAGIINFVVLTAALSGCNSGMYSCGRMLYALAKNRQLPAAMAKVSRHGVPVAGVAVSIAILLIGSCLNYIIPNPQRVFVYVYSASVLPGMVPWFVILISQLRFRRAHKAAIASHPFRSILFPWANYVTMAFLICVLIGMYFNEDTRMSLFVGIIFMLAVTAIYKVFGLNRHGKAHKLEE